VVGKVFCLLIAVDCGNSTASKMLISKFLFDYAKLCYELFN